MKISSERIKKLKSFRHSLNADCDFEIERIGGLFPRGYLSIVASPAGIGKTWFMLYLICNLSVGGEVLGGLKINSKPQRVLVMSGETGNKLLDKRVSQTCWKFNRQNISIYNALDFVVEGIDIMLNSTEGQENIFAIVSDFRPDVIFFDTLISFHTLDEIKQGGMTKIYMFLSRIAHIFNCAVVCNHHTRKRSTSHPDREQTQDDVIGTSAGVRLAHAVYMISSEDLGEGKSKLIIKNAKSWDKKIAPFSMTFIEKEGYIDFSIDLYIDEKWGVKQQVINVIENMDKSSVLKPSVLANTLHVSERRIRQLLDDFVDIDEKLSRHYLLGSLGYMLKDTEQ